MFGHLVEAAQKVECAVGAARHGAYLCIGTFFRLMTPVNGVSPEIFSAYVRKCRTLQNDYRNRLRAQPIGADRKQRVARRASGNTALAFRRAIP
ncbi:hypothetical protein GCM10027093_30510 [Paraburkholderia jirisanensis]